MILACGKAPKQALREQKKTLTEAPQWSLPQRIPGKSGEREPGPICVFPELFLLHQKSVQTDEFPESDENHGKYKKNTMYGDGSAGEKIVRVLENVDPPLQKRIKY